MKISYFNLCLYGVVKYFQCWGQGDGSAVKCLLIKCACWSGHLKGGVACDPSTGNSETKDPVRQASYEQ